jgi:hypothetical protein
MVGAQPLTPHAAASAISLVSGGLILKTFETEETFRNPLPVGYRRPQPQPSVHERPSSPNIIGMLRLRLAAVR